MLKMLVFITNELTMLLHSVISLPYINREHKEIGQHYMQIKIINKVIIIPK